MRRLLLPATASLAALTAVALLGAGFSVRPSAPPAAAVEPIEEANRAVIFAFYEAVNAAIATGDLALFEAVVAPGYVDRGAPPGIGSNRDGLARRLLALRAAAPGLRLGVEALAADGEVVIAHVRLVGDAPATFLGLRSDEDWAAWGPVDVFRLEAGRIVERWGPDADPIPPLPALHLTIEALPPESRSLTVARLTLAPGATYAAARQSGPRILFAEIGAIAVAPVAERDTGATPPTTLRAGEHILLSGDSGFAVRNITRSSAILVEITLVARPYTESPPPPTAPSPTAGMTVQILSEDLLVTVPSSPAVLAIGRLTLGSGERFGWLAAAGPVLLHVEAGKLDLTASAPVPWLRATVNEPTAAGSRATLSVGGGALLEAGTAAEVLAALDSPTTVLVVTLLPAAEAEDDGRES